MSDAGLLTEAPAAARAPVKVVRPSEGQARRLWIKQKDSSDNAWAAAANLLALLGVKLPDKVVKDELTAHPEYPGLTAVMDSLDEFGVKAEAVSGVVQELPDITYPNIAHFKKNGAGHFVVLWKVDAAAQRVTWLDPEEGWKEDSWAEFGKLWSGVILLAEAPTHQPQGFETASWKEPLAKAMRMALPTLFLLAIGTFIATDSHFIPAAKIWFALYIVGLVASVLAVIYSMGGVKNLCPTGKTLNCGNVLKSPASKIFGWLPMADLGVIYFSCCLIMFTTVALHLSLPSGITHLQIFECLSLLTILSIPYSVFALAYQGFKLRQWCTLCLVVQGVLLSQACISIFIMAREPKFGFYVFLETTVRSIEAAPFALFVSYCLTALWLTLRPMIKSHLEIDTHRQQARRLQNDPATIENAMKRAAEAPAYTGVDIGLGNPEAPFELVVVAHPHCGHCARAHEEIQGKMLPFQDIMKIRMRFMIEGLDDPARPKALLPLSLWMQGRKPEAMPALHKAFASDQSTPKAASAALTPEQTSAANTHLVAQTQWAKAAGCEGTPAYFLNGKKLPAHVTLKSLRMFLRQVRRSN